MSPIALVFSIHLFFLILSLVERAQKSPFPFFDLLTLVLQPQSLTSCLFVHRCISSKPSPCTSFLSYFYSVYTNLGKTHPNKVLFQQDVAILHILSYSPYSCQIHLCLSTVFNIIINLHENMIHDYARMSSILH